MNIDSPCERLHIYTDASRNISKNVAGISFIIVDYKHKLILCEYIDKIHNVTNNQAELIAIGMAIEFCYDLKNLKKITIFTDSLYAKRVLNKEFKARKNVKLVKSILDLINEAPFEISIQWVRGHNGNKYNERADELSKIARLRGK